jgi:hydrogenase maturation protein HypF
MRTVRRMLERRLNAPLTSSAGRLFDAVASIAGVRDRVRFEGQAAMQLEWLAGGVTDEEAYPFELTPTYGDRPWQVDTRPLIRAVAADADRGEPPERIAHRFHHTLAEIITRVCKTVHGEVNVITLSGGVFMNALLLQETEKKLEEMGFLVFQNLLVPPNDGGLSLGQLAVAAQQLQGA